MRAMRKLLIVAMLFSFCAVASDRDLDEKDEIDSLCSQKSLEGASCDSGWFRPQYGELITSDLVRQNAIAGAPYSDERLWEEKESEYRTAIEVALIVSRVRVEDLQQCLFSRDPEWNLTNQDVDGSDIEEEEFLVKDGKFYGFSPELFDSGLTIHDSDKFNSALEDERARIRAIMAPPPLPLQINIGGVAKIIECGHAFCGGCLEAHRVNSSTCPLCRNSLVGCVKNACDGDFELGEECVICNNTMSFMFDLPVGRMPVSPVAIPDKD